LTGQRLGPYADDTLNDSGLAKSLGSVV